MSTQLFWIWVSVGGSLGVVQAVTAYKRLYALSFVFCGAGLVVWNAPWLFRLVGCK